MSALRPSERGPGLMVGEDVRIGEHVELGAHVVIHEGTEVGDGCTIQDGAVIGKRPQLGPRSRAARAGTDTTRLEPGAVVCCNAVVVGGALIASRAVVGDLAFVRERARVGEGSVVGQGSAIGARAQIGPGVRIQNRTSIVPDGIVEDGAFIGPSVTSADDLTMGRRAVDAKPQPIVLRRGCRIGAGVVLMPGVEVGEEAVVGAAALVMDDVAPYTVVIGSPARVFRELRAEERRELPAR